MFLTVKGPAFVVANVIHAKNPTKPLTQTEQINVEDAVVQAAVECPAGYSATEPNLVDRWGRSGRDADRDEFLRIA